jgi:hypothetical protein
MRATGGRYSNRISQSFVCETEDKTRIRRTECHGKQANISSRGQSVESDAMETRKL